MSIENQTTDPAIGREIGSYRVTGVLGKGGMGVVYRAEHPSIGKKVAVKLLNARFSTQQETVMRFFREARAVNDIHHENVIDVNDFGKLPSGECFIIMEFLDGKPLASIIKSEARLPVQRIGHILLQVCSALEAAHQKGIVHRDLKPDNIFLITRSAKPDFVKLLDFGIAKLLYDDDVPIETSTGAMIGTPMYMSPEQALGSKIDHQSDIYSLGIMLYQMATGVPPFYDNNPITMAMHHITKEAKPPREVNPDLSQAMSDVIMRCIAKEKADRYKTMREVARELGKVCGLDPAPYLALIPTQENAAPQEPEPVSFSTQETRASGQINPPSKEPSSASLQPTMGPGGSVNQSAPPAPQETFGASSGEVVTPTHVPQKNSLFLLVGVSLGSVVAVLLGLFGLGVIGGTPEAAPTQTNSAAAPVMMPAASLPVTSPTEIKEPLSQPAPATKPTKEKAIAVKKDNPKKGNKTEPKATGDTTRPTPSLDDEDGIQVDALEDKSKPK
jgi:serine/threonine protein kinase